MTIKQAARRHQSAQSKLINMVIALQDQDPNTTTPAQKRASFNKFMAAFIACESTGNAYRETYVNAQRTR